MRHLISGIDCAIAGAASVAAPAAPIPVTFKNSLRFMDFLPVVFRSAFVVRPVISMEHPIPDCHPDIGGKTGI
jgi:hypothetical protein